MTTTFPFERQIEHTAADWWARLRDPALPEPALLQWSEWLEADPRHADAFERASALAEAAATMDAASRREFVGRFAPARFGRRAPLRFALAVAAGVALVVLGSGLYLGLRPGGIGAPKQYVSERAGHRDIDLPDGIS